MLSVALMKGRMTFDVPEFVKSGSGIRTCKVLSAEG